MWNGGRKEFSQSQKYIVVTIWHIKSAKKLEKILPSDLSIILGISRTKLSKALKGLKSKGYIAQFPNKLDGRELYTTLTDAGNKLLEYIAKKHTSIFEIASKSFTKEEQKDFIRLSNILSNELRKKRLEKDEWFHLCRKG